MQKRRGGADRFGYRPDPDTSSIFCAQQQSKKDRQRVIDAFTLRQNHKKWEEIRRAQGHEEWYGFGNRALPIEKYREDIMQTIANNRISLLAGETGSGKSTQLAQYALEMGYDRIVYLQPRRVTADGIGERLDEELMEQFGARNIEKPQHLVGIAHSGRSTVRDDSIIQVMTSAVFTRRAAELREQWQDERVLVVADEIHEANIETEFAVATAAELMTERPSWNMVLMSATLNAHEIQDAYRPINGKPIPTITVEGRPHDIESYEYPDKTVIDVFDGECFESGHKTMIFTEGISSVKNIKKVLEAKYGEKVRVLPLHSKIDETTRQAIFHEGDIEGVHTVIVSTSAGMSGLTIPGVDRVVSDGWTKSPELDAEYAEGLPRRLCSRAELMQQRGRGGRDVDGGKFFLALPLEKTKGRHAFVREEFVSEQSSKRLDHAPPDIYHTIISRNVLSAAAMDRDFYILNNYLIHRVKKNTIDDSYGVLQMIGAVDERGKVTGVGRMMDKYPLRPELSRAIVEAVRRGKDAQIYRLAALTAAIEAGRLGSEDLEAQQRYLSPQTHDDFIKELDLFAASLQDTVYRRGDDEQSILENMPLPDEHNAAFDMVNVERAWKQFVKICQRAGIDSSKTELLTEQLTTDDMHEIYECLLTGMPHLLYEEISRSPNRGRRRKDKNGEKKSNQPIVRYRNMLGPGRELPYEYDRVLSTRSRLCEFVLRNTDIIAGYPRWYEVEVGKIINVIEIGFVVDRELIQRVLGHTATTVDSQVMVGADGKLRRHRRRSLGRIGFEDEPVGEKSTLSTIETRISAVLAHPGPALRSVWQLQKSLEDFAQRIPYAQQKYYFDKQRLTKIEVEAMIREAAIDAGGIGEVDANLRMIAAREGVHEDAYISPENRAAIESDMPRYMMIGETYAQLRYEDGVPIASGFSPQTVMGLGGRVTIPDGREVLFHYKSIDSDDEWLTLEELKRRASV